MYTISLEENYLVIHLSDIYVYNMLTLSLLSHIKGLKQSEALELTYMTQKHDLNILI